MPPLFLYWHETPAPGDVEAALAGIAAAHPGMAVHRHDHDSAADYIAARFGPREAQAFRACAVPAMQADLFRYCAVLAEGGFWLDADHGCAVPVTDVLPADADGVVFQRDNGIVVNGCFGFRAPGHPLVRGALEVALRNIEGRFVEDVWLTTGPGIFTFLRILSTLSPEQREHLDFDHLGPSVTQAVRRCDAVARGIPGDAEGMFARVHLAPFSEFERAFPPLAMHYKDGPGHWVTWQGSIFR